MQLRLKLPNLLLDTSGLHQKRKAEQNKAKQSDDKLIKIANDKICTAPIK